MQTNNKHLPQDSQKSSMSHGLDFEVTDDGSLQLYEYYAGKSLEEIYGDSDIEFYCTVRKEYIPKLLQALLPNEEYVRLSDRQLTASKAATIARKKFNNRDQFIAFLEDKNIKYETYVH